MDGARVEQATTRNPINGLDDARDDMDVQLASQDNGFDGVRDEQASRNPRNGMDGTRHEQTTRNQSNGLHGARAPKATAIQAMLWMVQEMSKHLETQSKGLMVQGEQATRNPNKAVHSVGCMMQGLIY